MLQKLNIPKRQLILTAALIATFMLPFVANISTPDAQTTDCFSQNRRQHVTCLRSKLDSTTYGSTVPKHTDGMGKYGCRTRNRRTHVTCLVEKLVDQGWTKTAGGADAQMPPPSQEPATPTSDTGSVVYHGRTCDEPPASMVGQCSTQPGFDPSAMILTSDRPAGYTGPLTDQQQGCVDQLQSHELRDPTWDLPMMVDFCGQRLRTELGRCQMTWNGGSDFGPITSSSPGPLIHIYVWESGGWDGECKSPIRGGTY